MSPLYRRHAGSADRFHGGGPAIDATALADRTGNRPETPLFLRADRNLAYAALMQVLDALQAAGDSHVLLVGLETAP